MLSLLIFNLSNLFSLLPPPVVKNTQSAPWHEQHNQNIPTDYSESPQCFHHLCSLLSSGIESNAAYQPLPFQQSANHHTQTLNCLTAKRSSWGIDNRLSSKVHKTIHFFLISSSLGWTETSPAVPTTKINQEKAFLVICSSQIRNACYRDTSQIMRSNRKILLPWAALIRPKTHRGNTQHTSS